MILSNDNIIMFNYCLAFIKNHLDFEEEDVSFEQIKFALSRLDISNYGYILNELIKQPYITNPIYSIYTQDLHYEESHGDDFNFITDHVPNVSIFPMSLDITNTKISMDALEILTVMKFIESCDNKYVILPIIYNCDLKKSGHIGCVVIDKEYRLVYLVDPNGKPSYFDNVLKLNVCNKIEDMLSKYFEMIDIVFIPSSEWNPNNIVINKHFQNQCIGSGHCSILTIMISHLLFETNETPQKIFEVLGGLNNDELLFIIKSYSIYIYQLLNKHSKLDKLNKIYGLYDIVKSNVSMNLDEFLDMYNAVGKNDPTNVEDNILSIFGLITVS